MSSPATVSAWSSWRCARGAAADSVGPRKRARLAALADAYLQAGAYPQTTNWRIDVVAVEMDGRGALRSVEVFQDAVGWR